MNIKRVFGSVLTTLGIIGLIYAAFNFVQSGTGSANIRMLITFGILGLVFFIYGISLVRATKDEA